MKFQISNFKFRIRPAGASGGHGFIRNSQVASRKSTAFSLVELLMVMVLLSLIMLALMQVFNSTQRAFRASVTQADVLQSGRAAMELITADLHELRPSGGVSNGPVNFLVMSNNFATYATMMQSLPGGTVSRTNLLNWFFVLGQRNGTTWTGTGYAVNSATNSPLFPLYRFYAETNFQAGPGVLFINFTNLVTGRRWTNMSHVMDGVVHLVVRAYDANGVWIKNSPTTYTNAQNLRFYASANGEAQFRFYSNTVPAAVEVQMGVLEDHVLKHAESLSVVGSAPSTVANQWNYLKSQSGAVHLFRQRVSILNVDPTAYQ